MPWKEVTAVNERMELLGRHGEMRCGLKVIDMDIADGCYKSAIGDC